MLLTVVLCAAALAEELDAPAPGLDETPLDLTEQAASERPPASLDACRANLRKLHRAIMQYARDHRGELPPGHRLDFPMCPGNPDVFNKSLLQFAAAHAGELPNETDFVADVGPGGGLKGALYPKYIDDRSVFYCPLHPEFNTDENWGKGRIGYFYFGNYFYKSDRDAFRTKKTWAPDTARNLRTKPLLQDLAVVYKEEDPATRGLEGRHFGHHQGIGVHVLTLGGEVLYAPAKRLHDAGSAHGQLYICTDPKDIADDRTEFELSADPLEEEYYDRPLPVVFHCYCRSEQGRARAEIALQNVETGERFPKTVEIDLRKGINSGRAVWETDSLPNGRYVVDALVRDGEGNVLVANRLTEEQVKQLTKKGGGTRWFSKPILLAQINDFRKWRAELTELEAKARSAGADTSLSHLTCVVLMEIARQSEDHLKLGWLPLVGRNHAFMAKAVADTRKELERITKAPGLALKAAAPADLSSRLTIRGGYFYAGDQPVFLCGPAMFNFLIHELPIVKEYGYNVIGVSTGPDSVFPDSPEPTGELRIIDYNKSEGAVCKVLDRCRELGLKVDLGLTCHFMPKWVYEKYPDARNTGPNFMMPYDIEHPEVLKLIERWYEIVMPMVAKHPALNTIWIANEPGYLNYGERNLALFREELRVKYGTVERLNEAWGTDHKSFDSVKKAPKFSSERQTPYVDWWYFSQGRVTRHFNWMKELIRKYDKEVPVCVKTMHDMMNPYFRISARINTEEVSDMSEALGFDSGTYPFHMCYYDWLRSLSPSKPLMNLEFYAFGPAERTKLAMWKAVMHGVAATDWWCWHPKDSFTSALSKAASMYHCARETYNIQRLMKEVMAFNRFPRSPFVFLYPNPVIPRCHPYFKAHDAVSYAIREMGYTIDYVTEKRVAAGRLRDYRIVVLPRADYISDATYGKVVEFVRNGGRALLIGQPPSHDWAGKERDISFLMAAGRGRVYRLTQLPASKGKTASRESISAAAAFLEQVIARELPPLPVMVRGCENRIVKWKEHGNVQTWLAFVANEGRTTELVLRPEYTRKVKGCTDLITGEPITPARIVIPPYSCRLLSYDMTEN